MSGVKGKSGRRKSTPTSANARRRIQQLLPYAIEAIEETVTGKNTDRLRYEAAVEVKNSALGKPKQETDVNVEGLEVLGQGAVTQLFDLLQERNRELREWQASHSSLALHNINSASHNSSSESLIEPSEDE